MRWWPLALAKGWAGQRMRRWLLIAAAIAALILLARGILGLILLGVSSFGSTFDELPPAILLAIEPWFVIGPSLPTEAWP